jgi:hypothetical protein
LVGVVGVEKEAVIPQIIRRGAVCRVRSLANETPHRRSFQLFLIRAPKMGARAEGECVFYGAGALAWEYKR